MIDEMQQLIRQSELKLAVNQPVPAKLMRTSVSVAKAQCHIQSKSTLFRLKRL